MSNKALLGYGEIGKAIEKCYLEAGQTLLIRDLDRDDITGEVSIIHVALPNTPRFPEEAVRQIIEDTQKKALVIIHSTVAPGTCKRLQKETGHKFIVHSPCLGVHPDLFPALITFKKIIGADFSGAGRLAAEEMASVGIESEVWYGTRTTELAKLMCLLYRSHTIALHDLFADWCFKEDVSFERAVIEWNKNYNMGYKKLGMSEVTRPICYPPMGKIGGHCQLPAAKMLKEHFGSHPYLEEILKML